MRMYTFPVFCPWVSLDIKLDMVFLSCSILHNQNIDDKSAQKYSINEQMALLFPLCLQTTSTLPGLPQHLSLPPQSQQPLTPSQLPWLAQLAASSCGEGVVVLGENIGSLAQGLQQMFGRLMEGRLENTNYVVIIVTAAGQETQSCVVVTGGNRFYMCVCSVHDVISS